MSIALRGITKSFQGVTVIPPLTIEFSSRAFTTLLGPSGCGKTTLLRMIAGLETPDAGEILFDGKPVFSADLGLNLPPEKRNIGFVFQDFALWPHLTVFENVAFPLRARKDLSDLESKVTDALSLVGLADFAGRRVSELSGGQQQRVGFARAIVSRPNIVLFDEPLSALDAQLRETMRSEIKRITSALAMTSIFVTHDQEEALTLSDRIAVFNNGYVEQVGTPYEIYNESKSEFVCDFIGDINRLKGELLSEVNTQSGANLDTNKTGFVRIERCIIEEKAGYVKLTGKVEEAEFSGVLTKYVLECHGQELKYLEKNDGRRLYQENEQIDLYINPQDIMQF